MRIRVLLAVLGVAALGAFAVPGVAAAAPAPTQEEGEEEHPYADHEAEECAHILEEGGEVDDCQEAPSQILPEPNEIIWGGLAFLILLILMWKFALPSVRKMMDQRTERIREDLEKAEQARTEAEAIKADYERQLAESRAEGARIVEEARQAADQVRQDLISRAEADAAEVRQRAQQDVGLATERAMADLQGRVAELSIDLAERVVERNLDRDTQIALIENYINEVGSGRA